MAVTYKRVRNFPHYRVGDDGTVWSCKSRNGRGPLKLWRPLKQNRSLGYPRVILYRETGRVIRPVHQLVLETFVGPCPPGMQACHFPDPDRANNALTNLRWGTPIENMADREKHGHGPEGERNPSSKLSVDQVRAIRARFAVAIGNRKKLPNGALARIAADFPVSLCHLRKIITKKLWSKVV